MCVGERLYRFANVKDDLVGQSQRLEVVPCPAGEILIPHRMMHDPSAVLADGSRQPGGGVPEARAELEHTARPCQPGQEVAKVSRCRPNGREPLLGRHRLHGEQFRRSGGGKAVEIA